MARNYYKPPHGYPYGKKRPPWFLKWRYTLRQIVLIIICFQTIRTIFLPTTFDVLLLVILVSFYWYCRKPLY